MTIDTKELRKVIADCYWPTSPVTINALLDRLEAAESEALEQARLNGMGSEREAALLAKLEAAEKERDTLRAKIEAMERQEPAGKFIQHPSNGLWEQDGYGDNPDARPLYALPGAQPAPSVPREAIEKMLTQLMDIAVSNGANSISMPDEYVEVAAWLCGIPAQPAPSVPDGFSREDLEAVADGLDGYEKTVNVGNVTGGGDDHLESTTAYAARFIRAMLAAAPEAKP